MTIYQALSSHSEVQVDFFDVHGGIYLANSFPSPIIRINPFFSQDKNHLKRA